MRVSIAGSLAVALLLVLGCGSSGRPGDGDPNTITLLTEPEPSVGFGERVPIRVEYVESSGTPRADVFIAFDPQGDTGDTRLSATQAATDSGGIAETVLVGGSQELDFDIQIGVPDDDEVAPITVRVRVQPKSSADYVIQVLYQGQLTGDRIIVSLYETHRACATLVRSPTDPPSTDIPWAELVMLPDALGGIPDRGLIVPTDVRLRYAVARGTASGAGPPYATFGCAESIPAPDPDIQMRVEIDLQDL